MKIVVSIDCATGGLSASLKLFLPEAQIIPIPFDRTTREHLLDAQVWVSTGSYTREFECAKGIENLQIVKIPRISFNAFHPDLTYAKSSSTGNLTSVHYNSKILIWCYNNKIDINKVKYFFNENIYLRLGYLNYWDESVDQLRNKFLQSDFSDFEFKNFLLNIKRLFLFMYSINHPKSYVLTELARLVANKLGVDGNVLSRNFVIPDGLTETVWPVYPEIAIEFGIQGDYIWKTPNGIFDGVEKYANYAFQNYEREGIKPSELVSLSASNNFNQIMLERANEL